ncbi:Protein LIAT1 [Chionoecetes opilio]|uniref:Protein LIAT1 n=1 Tax=Chionoecetes opilio TaxID=41210 RepID=A0A8J5CHY8_CHIOP|nr:Protein LIAT1 [Chionoecetes opilio]
MRVAGREGCLACHCIAIITTTADDSVFISVMWLKSVLAGALLASATVLLVTPTSRNVNLELRCDTFHLQESKNGRCQDFVRIQRVKYCGSNIPVISTHNVTKLAITFHSNGRFNYPGFRCSLTASNPNMQHCVCGKQGGNGTDKAPWVAALVYANESQPFCTASIVRETWVLTSATCAARIKHNKDNYAVMVGVSQGRGGVRVPIRKVFLHPASLHGHPHTQANLALIHLKQPITFRSGEAQPVCLPLNPAHHRPASGSPAWQGWRGVEVEEQDCLSGHLGPAWLCGQPADPCQPEKGDLGSPLVAESEGGGTPAMDHQDPGPGQHLPPPRVITSLSPPGHQEISVSPPGHQEISVSPPDHQEISVSPPDHKKFLSHPQTTKKFLSHPQTTKKFLSHPQTTKKFLSHPQTTKKFLSHPQATKTFLSHPQTTKKFLSHPQATKTFLSHPQTTKKFLSHPQTTKKFLSHPQTTKKFLSHPQTTKKFLSPPDHQEISVSPPGHQGTQFGLEVMT